MNAQEYPARFEISGVLLNVFQRPEGKSKDGQAYGGEWVLQLMSADHLRNGESKLVPTDLMLGKEPADKVEAEKYRVKIGTAVKFPATVYVGRGGQLVASLARSKGVSGGK